MHRPSHAPLVTCARPALSSARLGVLLGALLAALLAVATPRAALATPPRSMDSPEPNRNHLAIIPATVTYNRHLDRSGEDARPMLYLGTLWISAQRGRWFGTFETQLPGLIADVSASGGDDLGILERVNGFGQPSYFPFLEVDTGWIAYQHGPMQLGVGGRAHITYLSAGPQYTAPPLTNRTVYGWDNAWDEVLVLGAGLTTLVSYQATEGVRIEGQGRLAFERLSTTPNPEQRASWAMLLGVNGQVYAQLWGPVSAFGRVQLDLHHAFTGFLIPARAVAGLGFCF